MGQSNCQQYRNVHMVITSPHCITDCFNCLSIIGIFTLSVDVDKQIFLILGKMCDFSDENSISSAKVGIIRKQISCEYKLTWYLNWQNIVCEGKGGRDAKTRKPKNIANLPSL